MRDILPPKATHSLHFWISSLSNKKVVVPDCEPPSGSYILKTENGSGRGGVILSSIVLPADSWDPLMRDRKDGWYQANYCQTHKRKALQMWRQLASESMLWNNLSLKTPGCGCGATCNLRGQVSTCFEVPATPTQLHMHWAFSRIPHPLFSSWMPT